MNKTKDYSIFREFVSNREIDRHHLKRLTEAIRTKNLLPYNPIIVDKNFRIIDGQHRLAAAQNLGLEIYYIIADVDRTDISKLNTNQKNWNTMDYVNFFTIEGLKAFKDFSHLINLYPFMNLSALLSICSADNRRNTKEIRTGYLDVSDIPEAKKVCSFCKELQKNFGFDFVFDSRFPLALKKIMTMPNFSEEILLKHIEDSPRDLVHCHTTKQYQEMLTEIYNRRLSKNKL